MEELIEYLKNIDPLLTALTIALTAILAGGAIAAAIFTWKQLSSLREQDRRNTFMQLLKELGERDKRRSRRLIFELYEEAQCADIKEAIKDLKKYDDIIGKKTSVGEYRDAIEETVSCLDRLGYFLLTGGNEFIKDAPDWIWTITSQMWDKSKWYIDHREKTHKYYVKYFKKLNKIAKAKLKQREEVA